MTVTYPALAGRIIKEVRFNNDSEFTVIVLEFTDHTEVSFRLEARIAMRLAPEIAFVKNGNITKWKKLKAHRRSGKA